MDRERGREIVDSRERKRCRREKEMEQGAQR